MEAMIRVLSALFLLTVSAGADVPLTIELISEVTSIAPGQPFYVGLALHHGEGYHTYWKHPGVVGVPTDIKWEGLPKGFSAEPIDWPEPQAVRMFTIKAQGYERDVVLPIKITPPVDLKDGTTITLQGKAHWMACNRDCNPGFQDLSITLPIKHEKDPAFDAKWLPKFIAELATRPRPSGAWQAKITSKDKHHTLTLTPNDMARPLTKDEAAKLVFITEDGIIDSDKPQKIELRENGEVVFELIEAEYIIGGLPKQLVGVILRSGSWEQNSGLRCIRVIADLNPK